MWKNLPYKGLVYFSLALNIILAVLIFALKNNLPPITPLFYGLPSGIEQLAPSLMLFIVPASGLSITIINIFLSNLSRDLFIKRTLIISSAFVSLLLSIAVIKIVLLVGSF